ncbi:MAG TPA: RDD family protein [Thermoanaerobaculia bacterium]|jgi:uncharacterized RDD family membrane protein YckC
MNEDPRHEPGLFDLPLEPPPTPPAAERAPRAAVRPRGESLPLFSEAEIEEALGGALGVEPTAAELAELGPRRAGPRPLPVPPPAPPLAPLGRRGRAAAGDLTVLAAAGVVAAAGASRLGVAVEAAGLVPLALFVLSFSFVYFVIPLAFWGGTPGMIWSGLVARNAVTEPLSFGQSVRRWLGTWLTWALAGLPGLLALTGRSLTDRLSRSATYALTPPAPG